MAVTGEGYAQPGVGPTTAAPSGAAGGELGGTYPNPTLAGPVAGNMTFSNGITIATTKTVAGASELTLNAATGQPIALQINGSEKARLNSGALLVGVTAATSDNLGIAIQNNTALRFRNTAGNAYQDAYFVDAANAHYVGDSNSGTLRVICGSAQYIYFVVGSERFRVNANGLLLSGGVVQTATAVKTSAYTILVTDRVVRYNTSGGAFAITLPSPATAGNGWEVYLEDWGFSANAMTLTRAGAEKINNAASNYSAATANIILRVTTNGTDWLVQRMAP